MIHYFKKFFYPEAVTYSYPKPKEEVVATITEILSHKTTFFDSIDMRGSFFNSNSFTIESISPSNTRGVKYRSILTGKITTTKNGATEIITTAKQSIVYYLLFCVTIIFGLLYCYQYLLSGTTGFLLLGLALLLIGPFAVIGLCNVANASVRERYNMYIDKVLRLP
jgi:hypothetical protein